jgi:hypothetical protein
MGNFDTTFVLNYEVFMFYIQILMIFNIETLVYSYCQVQCYRLQYLSDCFANRDICAQDKIWNI